MWFGQIFRRPQHPLKSLPAGARSRFTSPVPWGDLFIPGALVQGPDSLFYHWIADYEEPPALHIAAAGGTDARFEDLSNEFIRHRVGLQSPHRPSGPDYLEQSAVDFVRHGVLADARLGQPRLSDAAGWCKDRLRRTDLLYDRSEAGECRADLGVMADNRRLKHR
jgi:hypothetical protein